MTVVSVDQDPEALTMTVVAEFAAPVERVWELWSDPRKLERWWGPPSHPATFEEHDLTPGGRVTYFMTGPDGERYPGVWHVAATDPPRSIRFEEGFTGPDGNVDRAQPVTVMTVTFTDVGDGSRMEMHNQFADAAAMEQVLAMGAAEGMTQAVEQMDALLVA